MSRRKARSGRIRPGADTGPRLDGCLGWGLSISFALAGSLIFIHLALMPILDIVGARDWQAVDCTILTSEVESKQGSDSTTYQVALTYAFELEGTEHVGNRYDFSIGGSSGYQSKADVVERFPPGTQTTCWVDPDDPSRSVIQRDPGLFLLWGCFPLPFLAVGFGGIALLLLFGGKRGKKRVERISERAEQTARAGAAAQGLSASAPRPLGLSSTPSRPRTGRTSAGRTSAGRTDTDRLEAALRLAGGSNAGAGSLVSPSRPQPGPLSLESGASNKVLFFVFLVIGLFWNGFVTFFSLPMISDWDGSWGPVLFLVPFALAGLGLLGASGYYGLATFNPTLHLTLSEGDLRLGESCSLSWKLTGNPGRLRSLKISLEGRESATYRRGTSTYTDHSIFHRQIVLDEQRLHFKDGRVVLEVPRDSVPTFEAHRNQIQWRVVAHGDIPWWPDVSEVFPIWIGVPRDLEDLSLEDPERQGDQP